MAPTRFVQIVGKSATALKLGLGAQRTRASTAAAERALQLRLAAQKGVQDVAAVEQKAAFVPPVLPTYEDLGHLGKLSPSTLNRLKQVDALLPAEMQRRNLTLTATLGKELPEGKSSPAHQAMAASMALVSADILLDIVGAASGLPLKEAAIVAAAGVGGLVAGDVTMSRFHWGMDQYKNFLPSFSTSFHAHHAEPWVLGTWEPARLAWPFKEMLPLLGGLALVDPTGVSGTAYTAAVFGYAFTAIASNYTHAWTHRASFNPDKFMKKFNETSSFDDRLELVRSELGPALILAMRKMGLILNPVTHAKHHAGDATGLMLGEPALRNAGSYGIFGGWLLGAGTNFLDAHHFHNYSERWIFELTHALSGKGVEPFWADEAKGNRAMWEAWRDLSGKEREFKIRELRIGEQSQRIAEKREELRRAHSIVNGTTPSTAVEKTAAEQVVKKLPETLRIMSEQLNVFKNPEMGRDLLRQHSELKKAAEAARTAANQNFQPSAMGGTGFNSDNFLASVRRAQALEDEARALETRLGELKPVLEGTFEPVWRDRSLNVPTQTETRAAADAALKQIEAQLGNLEADAAADILAYEAGNLGLAEPK